MPTNVILPAATLPTVKAQTVYVKQRWADTWQPDSRLWCESADWFVAPAMPAAHLSFRYGKKYSSIAGDAGFTTRAPIDRLTYFVKVVYNVQPTVSFSDSQLIWYGIVDVSMDDLFAPLTEAGVGTEGGRCHFVAYGLERLLDDCEMLQSYVSNGIGAVAVNRPLDFNAYGKPNRAEVSDSDGVNLFMGKPDQTPQWWNTRGAVRYLLKYHSPKNQDGETAIPFRLDDSALLPNWDQPTVSTDGVSVRELLNAFISRQRLLGHKFEVEADETVILRPFTYTGEDITIEGINGATIRANPVQVAIDHLRDRTAQVAVTRHVQNRVDRVVCTGAQRTSTGTFSKYQGSLDKGWKIELANEYNAGGASDPAYPPSSEADKRWIFTILYRMRDRFKPVFARFVVPASWNGKVGNGYGPIASEVLMPDSNNDPTPLAAEDWRFLREIPFKQNYSYTASLTSPTKIGDFEHDFLAPIVLFPRGDSTEDDRRYRPADGLAMTADLPELVQAEDGISCQVQVKREDGALWLTVEGGYQHMVAKNDFVPINCDEPTIALDWQDMLVTATLAWSEFATGYYPTEIEPTDAARILTLDLGDGFRADYVAKYTVIGLDAAGRVERVPDRGYLRDDRALLRGLAQAAYDYYYPVRSEMTLSTSWITSAVLPGYFVTQLKDTVTGLSPRIVNTVCTHLAIHSPSLESEDATEPPVPKMTIETDHAELNPVKLLGGYGAEIAHPRPASAPNRL